MASSTQAACDFIFSGDPLESFISVGGSPRLARRPGADSRARVQINGRPPRVSSRRPLGLLQQRLGMESCLPDSPLFSSGCLPRLRLTSLSHAAIGNGRELRGVVRSTVASAITACSFTLDSDQAREDRASHDGEQDERPARCGEGAAPSCGRAQLWRPSGLGSIVSRLTARLNTAEIRANVCGAVAATLAPLALQGGALAARRRGAGVLPPSASLLRGAPGEAFFGSLRDRARALDQRPRARGSRGDVPPGLARARADLPGRRLQWLLHAVVGNTRLQRAAPGPGVELAAAYVLITFINGTMSTIDLVQAMLQQNFPVLLLTLPLSKNLAHAVSLLVPGASFLGAYCGWQHIKMQKKLAMEAYYQQVEYMLQNPPWPPPPLPMQIVQNMVMQYSAGALQEAGLAQLEDGSIVDARTGTPIEQLMPELADMMAGASDPDVLWAHRDALKDRLPTLREEEEDFAEEAGGKRGEPRGAQTSPSVQLPPTSMSAPAIAMEANTLGY
eukprot:CAMPEP_0117470938 /NCGR_PEP_ID=MMETSP0784-20121206/7475_1 /TAXON_ID=39447 /ORGANISM="" /LENGTH=502 /DNA_ID=CAMNT_0005265045 /DNA_START=99 /DNA_END=1608 /DNA_ORIENTATION=+